VRLKGGLWPSRVALVPLAVALLALPPLLVRGADTDLVTLLVFRFCTQSIVLGIVLTHTVRSKRSTGLHDGTFRSAMAGVAFATYLFCFFASLTETSVERAILLSSLYVAVVVVIRWVTRMPVPATEAVGALLVIAALAVGVAGDGSEAVRGDVLAAVSGLFFAAYVLVSAPRLRNMGWGEVIAHQAVVSFVGLILAALVLIARWTGGGGPVGAAVPVGLMLGVLGALGHVSLSRVQSRFSVSVTATTAAMSPVVAGALGAVLFNRSDLSSALVALGIASAGFLLVNAGSGSDAADGL